MNDKHKTLLIVDDSIVVRKSIVKFLEEYDLKVVGTASNGTVALEMFKKFHPDFVTLDITMPGLDGFHVLHEMVKLNQASQIIVITALADKATGLKAIRSGAKSFLTKPFGPAKLKEAFERLLS
jgi:two-component system chemotaxis response regulator CheY